MIARAPGPGRAEHKRTYTADYNKRSRSHPPINTILGRLGHLRKTGDDQWLARCPAHRDRSPSLSICEQSNRVVLLHCFAGCETTDVLDAIGLEFGDLYPEDICSPRRERYSDDRLSGREIVSVLNHELLIVEIFARAMMSDPDPSPDDAERLALACSRIRGVVRHVF